MMLSEVHVIKPWPPRTSAERASKWMSMVAVALGFKYTAVGFIDTILGFQAVISRDIPSLSSLVSVIVMSQSHASVMCVGETVRGDGAGVVSIGGLTRSHQYKGLYAGADKPNRMHWEGLHKLEFREMQPLPRCLSRLGGWCCYGEKGMGTGIEGAWRHWKRELSTTCAARGKRDLYYALPPDNDLSQVT